MASTAALVFFWRLGRTSLRAAAAGFVVVGALVVGAVVVGAVVGGGVVVCSLGACVCAIADAATDSRARIKRILFIFVLRSEKDNADGCVCATGRANRARTKPALRGCDQIQFPFQASKILGAAFD